MRAAAAHRLPCLALACLAWLFAVPGHAQVPVPASAAVPASGAAATAPPAEDLPPGGEAAERARIAAARTAIQAEFDARTVACYQRFAVNDCLHEARVERRQQLDELRRQEIVAIRISVLKEASGD